jgi:hypothetical protein
MLITYSVYNHLTFEIWILYHLHCSLQNAVLEQMALLHCIVVAPFLTLVAYWTGLAPFPPFPFSGSR